MNTSKLLSTIAVAALAGSISSAVLADSDVISALKSDSSDIAQNIQEQSKLLSSKNHQLAVAAIESGDFETLVDAIHYIDTTVIRGYQWNSYDYNNLIELNFDSAMKESARLAIHSSVALASVSNYSDRQAIPVLIRKALIEDTKHKQLYFSLIDKVTKSVQEEHTYTNWVMFKTALEGGVFEGLTPTEIAIRARTQLTLY